MRSCVFTEKAFPSGAAPGPTPKHRPSASRAVASVKRARPLPMVSQWPATAAASTVPASRAMACHAKSGTVRSPATPIT